MSRKIADLAIPAGTYTDRTGNEKTKWENIGGMFEGNNGKKFITIRRTFAPAGIPLDDKGTNRENVILHLFSAENGRGY